jgi:hypothetical protein
VTWVRAHVSIDQTQRRETLKGPQSPTRREAHAVDVTRAERETYHEERLGQRSDWIQAQDCRSHTQFTLTEHSSVGWLA